jgi:hypothetical protein
MLEAQSHRDTSQAIDNFAVSFSTWAAQPAMKPNTKMERITRRMSGSPLVVPSPAIKQGMSKDVNPRIRSSQSVAARNLREYDTPVQSAGPCFEGTIHPMWRFCHYQQPADGYASP